MASEISMSRAPIHRDTTAATSRAFPNAYLEVDEPPRRTRQKAFALLGLLGTACFILVVITLHFEPTGYNPVSQAVSDYGVGRFGALMDLGFFSGGLGLVGIAMALASGPRKQKRAGLRASAALLLVAGAALFMVGLFPTDLEGAPATDHGVIHNTFSLVVFTLGPAAMVVLSHAKGRRWLGIALGALGVGAASIVINAALALDGGGLAERVVITAIFGWSTYVSYALFRDPAKFEANTIQ